MGRTVNTVPVAHGDQGRATPPPPSGFPPKYIPEHFEDVGRAMAVAALDLLSKNPWSRLVNSEHTTLTGVKDWLRRHIRGLRGLPRGPPIRSPQKAASKSNIAHSAPQ